MSHMLFQYRCVFDRDANPPTRKTEFDESLKTFASEIGLTCHMSALGGGTHTIGTIHHERRDVAKQDRASIAEWIKDQPVRLTASFGPIERDHNELELFGDVDDLVFTVDNLSKDDLQQAKAYQEKIRRLAEQSAVKHGLPVPKWK